MKYNYLSIFHPWLTYITNQGPNIFWKVLFKSRKLTKERINTQLGNLVALRCQSVACSLFTPRLFMLHKLIELSLLQQSGTLEVTLSKLYKYLKYHI